MGKSSKGLEVGPISGDQRLASIWQNQHEMQPAVAVRGPENLQRVTFKSVVRTGDGHPLREVLTVGSVWRCPSTPSREWNCWRG